MVPAPADSPGAGTTTAGRALPHLAADGPLAGTPRPPAAARSTRGLPHGWLHVAPPSGGAPVDGDPADTSAATARQGDGAVAGHSGAQPRDAGAAHSGPTAADPAGRSAVAGPASGVPAGSSGATGGQAGVTVGSAEPSDSSVGTGAPVVGWDAVTDGSAGSGAMADSAGTAARTGAVPRHAPDPGGSRAGSRPAGHAAAHPAEAAGARGRTASGRTVAVVRLVADAGAGTRTAHEPAAAGGHRAGDPSGSAGAGSALRHRDVEDATPGAGGRAASGTAEGATGPAGPDSFATGRSGAGHWGDPGRGNAGRVWSIGRPTRPDPVAEVAAAWPRLPGVAGPETAGAGQRADEAGAPWPRLPEEPPQWTEPARSYPAELLRRLDQEQVGH